MGNGGDLDGKHILITGANTGIGRATAFDLARRGASITIACRSQERGLAAAGELQRETNNPLIEVLPLDLASFGSIRLAAGTLLRKERPLHVLINNAGVAGHRGQTEDGFEIQFGVNHLGHFLLTALLWPRLAASAPARVVTVSSKAHYDAKEIRWDRLTEPTRTRMGLKEYQVSKLANVLFSAELARRSAQPEVRTYSLHPGVVASDIWRRVPWPIRPLMTRAMISNEDGAKTSLHCATAASVTRDTGLYYSHCEAKDPSSLAQDASLASTLWSKSETWCGETFDPS